MRFAYRQLRDKGYDAFCVFDADNVADPQFLREMNNAYRAGARAAQGYRDSKNPFDSAISGCHLRLLLHLLLDDGPVPQPGQGGAGHVGHAGRHRIHGVRRRL